MSQPVSGFEDKVDIGDVLVEPKDYGADLTASVNKIDGLLGMIDDAWQWLFGWSLWEWLFVPLSGNWAQLYSLSDGWEALSKAADGVSVNLTRFTGELQASWEGNASDAFAGYMRTWEDSLADEKDMCAEMSVFMNELAQKAEAVLDLVLSTVEMIVDIVLLALKAGSLAKALKEATDGLGKANAARKAIDKFIDVVDSFIVFGESLAELIRQADNEQRMPNGYVDGPEAPGTTKKKSSATKGGAKPAPDGT